MRCSICQKRQKFKPLKTYSFLYLCDKCYNLQLTRDKIRTKEQKQLNNPGESND